MGISPRHGSHAALPIACDALNARTVAVRKYHCIFCVSSPASRYTCFPARCWSLGCPGGDNLTRIASWRTRRMARRKRNVSDLPYAAPPLSCGGVRKVLSLGKLRQRHALIFPVLCFGLIFQRRPVSAFKLFPTLRKYGLSPCGEVCPGA